MPKSTTNKPVTDEKKSAAYFRNAIPDALHEYELLKGRTADEMSQNQFTAALSFIRNRCINQLDIANKIDPDNDIREYNITLLRVIADVYIDICLSNGKEVSLFGLSVISGVSYDVLIQWKQHDRRKASPEYAELCKKVDITSEQSKRNMLFDKGRNPVGILALLNHDYGYNLPGVSREVVPARLSADEIRHRIGLLSDNKPLTDTIETD